jgi:2'-5' RNA ligase
MLWARVADGGDLAKALEADVQAALVPLLGLEPEDRPYTPHITLVRVRRPHAAPAEALDAANAVLDSLAPSCGAGGTSPGVVSVRGVSVMSSRTLREGPVYQELAFVPLGRV